MNKRAHPWGTPPWTVNFRPRARAFPEQVDFCVVGGGFSGLSATAWLKRLAPSKSVLLLERATLGDGASGRTGGMALAETAAGDLPGLGDVLGGYRQILRALKIDAEMALPGAWELGRSGAGRKSPIHWNDSGDLRAVGRVPGGTVNPGKVVAGLARAAQSAGAQIVEGAEVVGIAEIAGETAEGESHARARLKLKALIRQRGRSQTKVVRAHRVLLATNAFSLELSDLPAAQPKLTMALATAPLSREQIHALGLQSRRPFYTVDLPYLWGRLMKNNGAIFGAGLVQVGDERDLQQLDVHKGEAAERLEWLESRVRKLHPCMEGVRITHFWGGPILLTEGAKPIFRVHPRLRDAMVLAGFNGHGVAQSVYLGRRAAEALVGKRKLPNW